VSDYFFLPDYFFWRCGWKSWVVRSQHIDYMQRLGFFNCEYWFRWLDDFLGRCCWKSSIIRSLLHSLYIMTSDFFWNFYCIKWLQFLSLYVCIETRCNDYFLTMFAFTLLNFSIVSTLLYALHAMTTFVFEYPQDAMINLFLVIVFFNFFVMFLSPDDFCVVAVEMFRH